MTGYFVRNKRNGKRANSIFQSNFNRSGFDKPVAIHFFLTLKEAKIHARRLNGVTLGKPWRTEKVGTCSVD